MSRRSCDKRLSRQNPSPVSTSSLKLPSVEVSAYYSTTSVLGQDNNVLTPCQDSILCSRVVELDSYYDTRYKVKKKEESTSVANIAKYKCKETNKTKGGVMLSSQLHDSWDESIDREKLFYSDRNQHCMC